MGTNFDEEFLSVIRPSVTRGASFSATTSSAKAGAIAMQMAGLPLRPKETATSEPKKPMAKES